MTRRLSAALAVALVAAGAIGAVGADSVLGSSGSSSSSDVLRDAWSTHEGRAVVKMSAEVDVDYLAIEDSTRVLIAVRPVPGQQFLSIPLRVQQQVRTRPVNQSRSDLVLPAIAVRGESTETEPMDAGRYRVVAIENGDRIDSTNLTIYPAAVSDRGGGNDG